MLKYSFLFLAIVMCALSAHAQLTLTTQVSNFLSQSTEVFQHDLDGDGDRDMIVTSVSNGFYWCSNNGDGTYEKTTLFYQDNIASYAYQITDVDIDGDPDFIYAGFNYLENPYQYKLYLLRNDGNLQFQSVVIDDTHNWLTNSIGVGTLNYDYYPDIVARDSTNIYLLSNILGNSWTITSQQPFESYDHSNLLVHDISQDGTEDVLIWKNETNALQYFNCVDGILQNSQPILNAPFQVIDIYVLDPAGDSYCDIFYVGKEFSNSNYYSLFHSSSGSLLTYDQTPDLVLSSSSDVRYESFKLHDFDADSGDDHIIIASNVYDNNLEFYEMNSDISATSFITSLENTNGRPVEIILDIDQVQDYALLNQDKLFTFEREGTTISSLQRHDETILGSNRDGLMDIDSDGDSDIIFSDSYFGNYTLWVYENLGGGSYGPAMQIATLPDGVEATKFQTGDFDQDNDDDILVMGTWSARLYLNENGTLIPDAVIENLSSIYGGEDFNNDGLIDLIASDYNYHTLIFSSENGNFFTGSNYDLGFGYMQKVLDFDNDGNLDIILLDGSTTKWLRNTNPATFSFSVVHSEDIPFNIGYTSHILQWDEDGIADYGWFYNENAAPHRIYLSGASYSTYVEMSENIEDDYVCDWNSDGLTDFFVSPNMPEMFVRMHQADGTFINTTVMPYHDEFITGVRDYDNDGMNEVLIRDFQLYLFEIGEETINANPTGIAFYDLNGNGIQESGEIQLSIPFQISNGGNDFNVWGINLGSLYNLSGEVIISPDFDPSIWTLTSDSISFHLSLNGPESWPSYPLNFGFLPASPQASIWSSLQAVNFSCADEAFVLQYSIHNNGNTYESGIAALNIDLSLAPFINIYPTPDSIVENIIYWSTENFAPGNILNCILLLEHPGAEFIGSIFSAEGVYTGTTTTSIISESEIITCAYDPNMIEVSPVGYFEQGYILADTDLLYTIHFQNTGNDTAVNVRVENQLTEFLDQSSFEIISFSHPMSYSLSSTGLINFFFDNILLPDSSHGSDVSSGFVVYRIRQQNALSEGTIIPNFVEIYFDLNPAIITNTVINTIWECDQSPITISQVGSTLTSSESENIQWYYNGAPIISEISSTLTIEAEGEYYVVQSEIYDCVTTSETITITSVNEQGETGVEIYPNPVVHELNISMSGSDFPTHLSVFNMLGENVPTEINNGASWRSINTSQWPAGIYFVSIQFQDGHQRNVKFEKL